MKENQLRPSKAFTLIELLIVVGIIAILASIAVVNFLEAQTRAKVSAVKSDLRTISLGLEAYAVDNNRYPPACGVGPYFVSPGPFSNPVTNRLIPVTTPIAYMSSFPPDKFKPTAGWAVSDGSVFDTFDYVDADNVPTRGSGLTSGGAWRLVSAGPDRYQAYGGRPIENADCNADGVDYDPTNGTVSRGDILRVGPLHTRYGSPTDPNNPNRPGIVRVPNYIEQWQQ